MEGRILNYQATAYPTLFKDTYWGTYDSLSSDFGPNIIANRDTFGHILGDKAKFISRCRCDNLEAGRFIGKVRIEVYKAMFGVVVIFNSQYSTNFKLAHITKKIAPLFSNSYTTYLKIFPDLRTANKFIKCIQTLFGDQRVYGTYYSLYGDESVKRFDALLPVEPTESTV